MMMITELLDRALGLNKINLLNEADFEVYDEVDDEDNVDIDTEVDTDTEANTDTEADGADGADDDDLYVSYDEVDDDIGEIEKGEAQDELDKIIDNIENVKDMSREEIEKALLGTTKYFTPKQWDNSTATIQINNQEGKPIGEVSARDIAATSDPIEFWTIIKQQIDDPNEKKSINQMLEKEDYDENEIRKYYWEAIQKIAQEMKNKEAFKTANTILKNEYYKEDEETAPANKVAKKYQESAADAQEKRYRKYMEEVIGLNPEILDKMAWTTSNATVKQTTKKYKNKGNITIGKKDPIKMKNNWDILSAGDIQQYTIYDTNDKIIANITDKRTHRLKPGNYYIKTKADGAWEIAVTESQAPGSFNRLAHVVAATTQSRPKFWNAVYQIAQDAGMEELQSKIQEMKKTGEYDEKLETQLRKQARETMSERIGKFFKSSGLKDLPPDKLGISPEQMKVFQELAQKKRKKEREKTIYEGDTIYGIFNKDGKMIKGGFDTANEAEEYRLDNVLDDAKVQEYPNDRSLGALADAMGPREQGWTTEEVTKALTPWILKLAYQTKRKFSDPSISIDDLRQEGYKEALEAFKRDDGSTPFAGFAFRNIANRMMSYARRVWEKMGARRSGGKTDIESTKERGWELIWKDPKDQPDTEPHKMIFQSSLPGGIDPDNLETDDGYLRVNNEKQNLINKGIPEENIEIKTTKTLKLGDPAAAMKKIGKSLLKKDTSEKIDSYVVLWIDEKDEEKRKEFETQEKADDYKNELLETGIPEDKIKVKKIAKSLIQTKAPSEFSPELLKRGGAITHYQIVYKDKDGDRVEADRLPSLKDKPGERYTTTSDENYQKLKQKLAKLIDADKVLWDDDTKSFLGAIVPVYSGQLASIEKPAAGDEGEEDSTIGAYIRSPISTPEQISTRREKIFDIMKKAELTKKEEDVLLASYGMEVSHRENKWDPKIGKEVPTKVVDVPAIAPKFREPEEEKAKVTGWVVKYEQDGKTTEKSFESSLPDDADPNKLDHGWLSVKNYVKNLETEGVPEESIEVQKTYAKSELIERPETEGLVDPNEVADLLKPMHPDILDGRTVNTIRKMAMDKIKEAVGQKEKAPVTITKQEFLAQKAAPKKSKKEGTKPPPKKPRPTEKETPEDKLDKALGIAKQAKEKQDEIKQLKDKEAVKKRTFFKGLEKEPDEEMVSAEETDRAEQLAILEYLILRDLKVIA